MSDDSPEMPGHVADGVESIQRIRAEHLAQVPLAQRLVETAVEAIGRARSIVILAVVVILWTGGSLLALATGHRTFDPPPFALLQTILSLVALTMTILILATQRHEDEMALRREHLTLQLSLLSEQKSAKIIALLEEMRRDSPHLADREDHQARDMSRPADPAMVIEAMSGE